MKKKDKSRTEMIAEGKISWVQKQYDEKGKLFCFDIMLPNLTMVSLIPEDFKEFHNTLIEAVFNELGEKEFEKEMKNRVFHSSAEFRVTS